MKKLKEIWRLGATYVGEDDQDESGEWPSCEYKSLACEDVRWPMMIAKVLTKQG